MKMDVEEEHVVVGDMDLSGLSSAPRKLSVTSAEAYNKAFVADVRCSVSGSAGGREAILRGYILREVEL